MTIHCEKSLTEISPVHILISLAFVFSFVPVDNKTMAQERDDNVTDIQSRYARLTCVHYLDSYLSLNTHQAAQLEKAFENKWGSDYDRNTWYMIHNGYSLASNVIELLDEKELESFLTQEQMDRFNQLSSVSLNLTDQLNWVQTIDQEDPIRDQIRLAGSLEIERLTRELTLDEKQVKRLRIAAKGAGAKILTARQKLSGGNAQVMLANHETFRLLMEGPTFQLAKTQLWANAITKTLTDRQAEIYRTSQKVKFDRSIDAVTFSFLMSYQREAKPFTFAEFSGLFAIIKKSLHSKATESSSSFSPSFYFESFSLNHDIKDEDVATVLSGEKLEHVKTLLAAARQRKADLDNKDKE